MRMLGIPRRGIGVVFHQLGAPNNDIFSSVESWATKAGMLASKNGWDMGDIRRGDTSAYECKRKEIYMHRVFI